MKSLLLQRTRMHIKFLYVVVHDYFVLNIIFWCSFFPHDSIDTFSVLHTCTHNTVLVWCVATGAPADRIRSASPSVFTAETRGGWGGGPGLLLSGDHCFPPTLTAFSCHYLRFPGTYFVLLCVHVSTVDQWLMKVVYCWLWKDRK